MTTEEWKVWRKEVHECEREVRKNKILRWWWLITMGAMLAIQVVLFIRMMG